MTYTCPYCKKESHESGHMPTCGHCGKKAGEWVDKPDSPGFWWTFDRSRALVIVDVWGGGEDYCWVHGDSESYAPSHFAGPWQRAIVPERPASREGG